MEILWWEKTVEYYFIQKHVDLSTFIAPLDGNHEKAGDAIFANTSSWVLIEFKRDLKSVDDELTKFSNYAQAKEELESIGRHHLIIYGEETEKADDINLVTKEYFSANKVATESALSAGIPKEQFIAYLKKFIGHKNNSTSGSGDFSLVAGVSQTGRVTRCMKIKEFGEAIDLEKKLQAKLDHEQANQPSSAPRIM